VDHLDHMTDPAVQWTAMLVIAAASGGYGWALLRMTRRGNRWPVSRSLSAAAGSATLAAAMTPALADSMDFRVHVVHHLLLTMLAPLLLALSAPVTLALRTLPHRARRLLLIVLHSRFVGTVTFAPIILALDVGGMYAYYLTPLFSLTMTPPWLHFAVHTHMFLAGCLLSWYLVGPDPAPRRPSTGIKIAVLFVAAGSHDLLAKLMYAEQLPEGAGTTQQLHDGAQIMFYGGDVIELLLAVGVLTTWYARTGRAAAHERRRSSPAGHQVIVDVPNARLR
jgi:putative membrane protein